MKPNRWTIVAYTWIVGAMLLSGSFVGMAAIG